MNKAQLDAAEREKDKDEISFLKQLMSERLGPKWDRLTIFEARKDRAKDLKADAVIKRVEDVEGMARVLCFEECQAQGNAKDYWKTVPPGVKEEWEAVARALRDYLMKGKEG